MLTVLYFRHANDFTIVPILVGSLSFADEKAYGELLAPYLADPSNLFVISSDFCHWGKFKTIQWCLISTFLKPRGLFHFRKPF